MTTVPFNKGRIRLPFNKSLYAKHTDEHFKLYLPIIENELFINIYVKKNKDNNGVPYIFEGLYKKYLNDGINKVEAVQKANEVVNDFFDICESLSKERKRPFKLRISTIDPSKIKKKYK